MTAQRAQEPASVFEAWRPMESAPRDGTMLRLLVEFTEHATEDSPEPSPTIGANNFDNDDIDEWKFAGWCWTHDHFTQGEGKPVGWLPMLGAAPAASVSTEAQHTERVLAALGHIRQPNGRCTAQYARVPKEERKPGPADVPVWCCLPAWHDGPHKCDHGGMHVPFVMRPEHTVDGEPLPDTCAKCRTRWPCPAAQQAGIVDDQVLAGKGESS